MDNTITKLTPTLDELRQAVIDAATEVTNRYQEYNGWATVLLGYVEDLQNTLDALVKAEFANGAGA